MYRQLVALSLAAFAAAAPLPGTTENASGAPSKNTKYTATFDDLNPGLLGGLISLTQVGPYDGLNYEGISRSTLFVPFHCLELSTGHVWKVLAVPLEHMFD